MKKAVSFDFYDEQPWIAFVLPHLGANDRAHRIYPLVGCRTERSKVVPTEKGRRLHAHALVVQPVR